MTDYVRVKITEIEPKPENAEENGVIWPRVLWVGVVPVNSETEIVLPSHDPRRPNSLHATELSISVEEWL